MPKLTPSAMIRANPALYRAYRLRRTIVVTKFNELGWGSRSKCARELGLTPSSLSSVLTGGRISEVTLSLVEDYLDLLED